MTRNSNGHMMAYGEMHCKMATRPRNHDVCVCVCVLCDRYQKLCNAGVTCYKLATKCLSSKRHDMLQITASVITATESDARYAHGNLWLARLNQNCAGCARGPGKSRGEQRPDQSESSPRPIPKSEPIATNRSKASLLSLLSMACS